MTLKYLLFTGVATNTCVEHSIRDAYNLEYLPILVSDATMNSGPPFVKEATFFNIKLNYGWLTSTEKVTEMFKERGKNRFLRIFGSLRLDFTFLIIAGQTPDQSMIEGAMGKSSSFQSAGKPAVTRIYTGDIPKPDMPGVKVEENIYVEMRDGVKLAVDIYHPEKEGRYPGFYPCARI